MKYIFSFMASLLLLAGCSGDFLDKEPTDSVSSDEVGVPGNAERLFNGAWYNLFEYVYTLANSGYRGLQCQDDMMADDVVSRPAYGFNSSFKYTEIAIPNNPRPCFEGLMLFKTIVK